ncbi:hypothetical protein PR048_020533, partial [Dryococelus australis]
MINDSKYKEETKVVKACLSLPHGNSEVERDFSTYGNTAAIKERYLNVIGTLKCYGNKPACVPITKDLIAYGRDARSKCHQLLEDNEKERKIAVEKPEDLKIKKIRKLRNPEKNAADKFLQQTTSCITSALKIESLEELQVAHGLVGYQVLEFEEDKANKETYLHAKTLGKNLC